MFNKAINSVLICSIVFSSCRREIDNKHIPESYSSGKRFYEEIKMRKSDSDSTTTLKFYQPNGVLAEKQELDENNLLMTRSLYDEDGLLFQTIDYTQFYDGDYNIIGHTFSDDGLEWQDIITIKEFYKKGNIRVLTNRIILGHADPQHEEGWERYTSIEDSVTRYYENGKLKETCVTQDGQYVRKRRLFDENGRMILEAKFSK